MDNYNSKNDKVIISGSSGIGKSTIAKRLAEKLGYKYLNTGAIYRCIALVMIENDLDIQNIDEVITLDYPLKITTENYKYLQLFDLIENKDNINIEVENEDELIYRFIQENELDFEKIIRYARETNCKKAFEKILVLAR